MDLGDNSAGAVAFGDLKQARGADFLGGSGADLVVHRSLYNRRLDVVPTQGIEFHAEWYCEVVHESRLELGDRFQNEQ